MKESEEAARWRARVEAFSREMTTTLTALTVADTLRKIAAEQSRYERNVINAETFAERVGDLIVRCDRIMKRD